MSTVKIKRKKQDVIKSLKEGNEVLSFSSFSRFLDSPLDFMRYKTEVFEPTEAMNLGSYFHALLLEPETVGNRFAVLPKYDKRNKEQKQKYLDFMEANEGKTIIPEAKAEYGKILLADFDRNDTVSWLFSLISEKEKRVEWEAFGFKWIGYLDAIGQIIFDLKKVQSATTQKMRWEIRHKKLLLQAAFYTIGAGFDKDYFILAFDLDRKVCPIHLEKPWLEQTWSNMEYYTMRFKQCIFLNQWNQSTEFWAKSGYYRYSQISSGVTSLNKF